MAVLEAVTVTISLDAIPIPPGAASLFPAQVMKETAFWGNWLARNWKQEVPMRIHSSQLSDDGTPEWHPDFERWLTSDRTTTPRKRVAGEKGLRTTRALRRLRKASPRSYEVAYRIMVLGERINDTAKWLNDRATRNDIPYPEHRPSGPHYTVKDALALYIAAVDYCRETW